MPHVTSRLTLCLATAICGLLAVPASADTYTCDDSGPCIVEAKRMEGTKVFLRWSGQGTSYDFYRITAEPHGGGQEWEYVVRGKKSGGGPIDLHEINEYEITVEGCTGSRQEPEDAVCVPSSEKVRMNLY